MSGSYEGLDSLSSLAVDTRQKRRGNRMRNRIVTDGLMVIAEAFVVEEPETIIIYWLSSDAFSHGC